MSCDGQSVLEQESEAKAWSLSATELEETISKCLKVSTLCTVRRNYWLLMQSAGCV